MVWKSLVTTRARGGAASRKRPSAAPVSQNAEREKRANPARPPAVDRDDERGGDGAHQARPLHLRRQIAATTAQPSTASSATAASR